MSFVSAIVTPIQRILRIGTTSPPGPLRGEDGGPISNPSVSRAMEKAQNAYEGEFNRPLNTKPGQADDNVLINLCAVAVDKGVAFLVGGEVLFETVKGAGQDQKSPADLYLDQVWKQNKKQTFLNKIAVNGGIKGHVYIKVVIEDELEYPRLIAMDPAIVSPLSKPDDVDNRVGYVVQWTSREGMNMVDHRETHSPTKPTGEEDDAPVGGTWDIVREERIGESADRMGAWRIVDMEVWPYPFPQIADCQNLPAPNRILGKADLERSVVHINEAINSSKSNTGRILRFHAHPKTVARGLGGAKINVSPDNVIELPGDKSELRNLEMQSDLGSSLAYADKLADDFYAVARIPPIALGKMDKTGPLSGVALSILYRPIIEKTNQKRCLYGDMLEELCRRLLVIGGYIEKTSVVDIAIHWPNYIPLVLQDAMGLNELGVSKHTLLQEFGYDPEAEAEKRKAENEEAMETAQASMGAFSRGRGIMMPAGSGGTPGQPELTAGGDPSGGPADT